MVAWTRSKLGSMAKASKPKSVHGTVRMVSKIKSNQIKVHVESCPCSSATQKAAISNGMGMNAVESMSPSVA